MNWVDEIIPGTKYAGQDVVAVKDFVFEVFSRWR